MIDMEKEEGYNLDSGMGHSNADDGGSIRMGELNGLHLRVLSKAVVINQANQTIDVSEEGIEEAVASMGAEQTEMLKALGYEPIEVVNDQIVSDVLHNPMTGEYLRRNPETGQYLLSDQDAQTQPEGRKIEIVYDDPIGETLGALVHHNRNHNNGHKPKHRYN